MRGLSSGRHVVVVANGLDGLVIRDADGRWRRSGFPELPGLPSPAPLRAFGANIEAELTAAPLIVLLTWMIGCQLVLRSGRGQVLTAAGGVVLLVGWLLRRAPLSGEGEFVAVVILAWPILPLGLLLVAAGVTRTVHEFQNTRATTEPDAGRIAAHSALTGLLFLAPFLGWTIAVPANYRLAAVVSLLATGAGIIITVRRSQPRIRQEDRSKLAAWHRDKLEYDGFGNPPKP